LADLILGAFKSFISTLGSPMEPPINGIKALVSSKYQAFEKIIYMGKQEVKRVRQKNVVPVAGQRRTSLKGGCVY
jgi:hypothetical protein